uniref:Uncharacterized protein n=1 Tax=Lygus hesperus TaxID=30085 RepID=A0A0A9YPZ2_LYGHE
MMASSISMLRCCDTLVQDDNLNVVSPFSIGDVERDGVSIRRLLLLSPNRRRTSAVQVSVTPSVAVERLISETSWTSSETIFISPESSSGSVATEIWASISEVTATSTSRALSIWAPTSSEFPVSEISSSSEVRSVPWWSTATWCSPRFRPVPVSTPVPVSSSVAPRSPGVPPTRATEVSPTRTTAIEVPPTCTTTVKISSSRSKSVPFEISSTEITTIVPSSEWSCVSVPVIEWGSVSGSAEGAVISKRTPPWASSSSKATTSSSNGRSITGVIVFFVVISTSRISRSPRELDVKIPPEMICAVQFIQSSSSGIFVFVLHKREVPVHTDLCHRAEFPEQFFNVRLLGGSSQGADVKSAALFVVRHRSPCGVNAVLFSSRVPTLKFI